MPWGKKRKTYLRRRRPIKCTREGAVESGLIAVHSKGERDFSHYPRKNKEAGHARRPKLSRDMGTRMESEVSDSIDQIGLPIIVLKFRPPFGWSEKFTSLFYTVQLFAAAALFPSCAKHLYKYPQQRGGGANTKMTWASESSHLDRTRFAHRANLHRSTCPSRRRKFLTPFTGCLPAPMYTTHVRGAFLPAHSPPSPPSPSPPPCRSLRAEAAAANSVWLLSKDPNNFEQGTSRNRSEEKRMWRGKESAEMREGNCFCYYISCKRYSFPFSPPPTHFPWGCREKEGRGPMGEL